MVKVICICIVIIMWEHGCPDAKKKITSVGTTLAEFSLLRPTYSTKKMLYTPDIVVTKLTTKRQNPTLCEETGMMRVTAVEKKYT